MRPDKSNRRDVVGQWRVGLGELASWIDNGNETSVNDESHSIRSADVDIGVVRSINSGRGSCGSPQLSPVQVPTLPIC
jgi:hypothetical protein